MAFVFCRYQDCEYCSGGVCDTKRTPKNKPAYDYCRRVREMFDEIERGKEGGTRAWPNSYPLPNGYPL